MVPAAMTPGQGRAERQGLYDPANEHDACGVGMVADLAGRKSHDIVVKALTVLRNLDHRGAKGAEPDDGDGAGILTQIPDELFREATGFDLPEAGAYAAGIAFLPADSAERAEAVTTIERIAAEEGLTVLGWRHLPYDPDFCGPTARRVMPHFAQLFLSAENGVRELALDRIVFCARERIEQDAKVYSPSLSSRTIVYKGMLTTPQLEPFFPDLSDRRYTSAIALVHSRFSTNTFPAWELATRTASSRTTVRSTPSRATGSGCGPARRCSAPTCSPATCRGSSRSSTSRPATRPRSTSALNCSTSAGGRWRTRCS